MRSVLFAMLLTLLTACGAATSPWFASNESKPTGVGWLLVFMGQSNMIGKNDDVPSGLPDPTIPEQHGDYHYNDGTHVFGALRVSAHGAAFSHEIRFARRLQEAGFKVAVAKLVQGATFINRWPPGVSPSAAGGKCYLELEAVKAQLDSGTILKDIDEWRYVFVWDQGEAEARYDHLPTVEHWSIDYAAIKAGVADSLGKAAAYSIVVRTNGNIRGKTFPGVLEAEQESVTDGVTSFWVDTNDLPHQLDGVHRQGIGQNMLGDREADLIIPRIRAVARSE